jgi:KaiC/GvpD/RAD55 family RecA-like ATPase
MLTQINLFTDLSGNWGVSISREGQLPQTILPSRETVFDYKNTRLGMTPLSAIRKHSYEEARLVADRLAFYDLDKDASFLRSWTPSWLDEHAKN